MLYLRGINNNNKDHMKTAFTIIILAMVGLLVLANKLDEKRDIAYEGCTSTEDYQVICE